MGSRNGIAPLRCTEDESHGPSAATWLVCRQPAPMKRAPRLRFDADVVVHGFANPLLAAKIALGRLHGDMSEKELDLLQFSTRGVAQLRARTPEIMRCYLDKSEFPRVLFHNVPDYSFRYPITPVFACATHTSEQSSG